MAPSRILVVDDEPDVEHLIKRLFRRQIRERKYQFEFAADGVAALEAVLAKDDIFIVLCDINMPRMDGLALLGHLGDLDRDIGVVMVSAYGDMSNIRTAMNRGAYDFVTKPIEVTDLSTTIEKTERHIHVLTEGRRNRTQLAAVNRELELGERIQRSIVPAHFPGDDRFEIFASMRPARVVGGDFYDAFALADGSIMVAIADVCGKGIPAAIYMAVSQTMLRAVADSECDPGRCMGHVNDLMCRRLESSTFVSAILARYQPGNGELELAIAGHPPPLRCSAHGTVEPLAHDAGLVLGVEAGVEYPVTRVRLSPGDSVTLYTDGITEARGADGEEFSETTLTSTLASLCGEDAATLCERLMTSVAEFANGDARDDMTCLALKRIR